MAFSKTLVLYRSWGNLGRCSLVSVTLTTIVVMSLREEEPFRLHSMDRKYLGLVSKSRLLLTYRIPEEKREALRPLGPQWQRAERPWAKRQERQLNRVRRHRSPPSPPPSPPSSPSSSPLSSLHHPFLHLPLYLPSLITFLCPSTSSHFPYYCSPLQCFPHLFH